MDTEILSHSKVEFYLVEALKELSDGSQKLGVYSRHVDEITDSGYWIRYINDSSSLKIVQDCITLYIEFINCLACRPVEFKYKVGIIFYLKKKKSIASCIKTFALNVDLLPFVKKKYFAPPEIFIERVVYDYQREKKNSTGYESYTRSFTIDDPRITPEAYSIRYKCYLDDKDKAEGFGFYRNVAIFTR